MDRVPYWVSSAVGIYAVLGSIFFVILIVVACYTLVLLSDLSKQVKNLAGKIEQLTTRVQSIADQVHSVTTEVGVRTTGIVRMVDESAGGAIRILEILAPVLVVFGAFLRIKRMVKGRQS